MRTITREQIKLFQEHLINEEKTTATVRKYVHDVDKFMQWLSNSRLDKVLVLAYKNYLTEHYAPTSVNAALSSLNRFFTFMAWHDLRVKNLKIQKKFSQPRIKN